MHTAQASEDVSARKAPGDLNFSQTVAKAELNAAGKALMTLADAVRGFTAAADK